MLALVRSVVGVIVGYIIFAASALAVFRLSGRAAHADALLLMAPSVAFGGVLRARAAA